jgi:hypothetical protein
MHELILFYGLLSFGGLMGVGYSFYLYHKHKHDRQHQV